MKPMTVLLTNMAFHFVSMFCKFSELGRIITILTLLVSVMCIASPSGATKLFRDLPEGVSRLLIKREIISTIVQAQKILIEHFDKKKQLLSKSDIALWKNSVGYTRPVQTGWKENLTISGPVKKFVFGSDVLQIYDISILVNLLEEIDNRLNDLKCDNVELIKYDNWKKDIDHHNFLVFYLRVVHLTCGGAVSWEPSTRTNDTARFLHGCFKHNESFSCLHEYYENRPRSFFRSRNYPEFFNVLAFQYLSTAFKAQYLCMVESEFLASRNDLKQSFEPELLLLHEYIILIIRNRLSFC